jgi:hypothetical protein
MMSHEENKNDAKSVTFVTFWLYLQNESFGGKEGVAWCLGDLDSSSQDICNPLIVEWRDVWQRIVCGRGGLQILIIMTFGLQISHGRKIIKY